MPKRTKSALAATLLVTTTLASGCGMLDFQKKEEIDPPQDIAYLEDSTETEVTANVETETSDGTVEEKDAAAKEEGAEKAEEKGEKAGTSQTEIYLIDANGYVVPQTLTLPKAENEAKQALEYMVANGPVSEILPNGFKAVLPPDTSINSVDIKDGVATVDFSKEFKEYKAEEETSILEAVTWTLTQFEGVKKVKLQIEGTALKEMPVNKTAIPSNTSRNIGINTDTTESSDIMNTRPVTVYFMAGDTDNYYYVPVTKRISNAEGDVEAVLASLIKGPGYSTPLVSEFRPDTELLDEPSVKDGVVSLNFNESIYSSFDGEEKVVSQHLLNELVLSLTEQKGIDKVDVQVNGEYDLMQEDGKKLTEPVSRPENLNTGEY